MKWLKRTGSFLWFLFIILISFYGLSSGPLSRIWASLKSSDAGVLVEIAQYFKNVDSLAILTMCISFGLAMGLLLLLNSWLDKILKKIAARFNRLRFLNTQWADYAIQTPIAGAILLVLFVAGSNAYVQIRSHSHRKDSVTAFTEAKPVVVLGTSKMLRSGNGINLYYKYRIDAAIALWKAGKVKYFILSGDGVGEGHEEKYDETADMKSDLIAMGVPEDRIKIDPYGLRTVDSSLRLRSEFNVADVIYISQGFHTSRAIIQSEFYGIKSESLDAKGTATFAMWRKEILQSRPALIVDVLFANMQPTVLGKDGKPIVWREEFSATKSNLHVMILIGTVLLVFISVMGYGFTRAKKGADREKAVKTFAIISSGLSILLIVMVWQIYETVDIKIFDEVVETVAATVGVKTEKMEIKIKKAEEVKEKIKMSLPVKSQIDSTKILKPDMRADNFNNVSTSNVKKIDSAGFHTVKVITKKPVEKVPDVADEEEEESTGFNVVKDNKSNYKKTPTKFFHAKVHNTQVAQNDKTVWFRTDEDIVIDGTEIPKNYIFSGKINVLNGKILFTISQIAGLNVDILNYDQQRQEGTPLLPRHQQNGSILLPDGEAVFFNL